MHDNFRYFARFCGFDAEDSWLLYYVVITHISYETKFSSRKPVKFFAFFSSFKHISTRNLHSLANTWSSVLNVPKLHHNYCMLALKLKTSCLFWCSFSWCHTVGMLFDINSTTTLQVSFFGRCQQFFIHGLTKRMH